MMYSILFLTLSLVVTSRAQDPTPVVLWHGLGGYHNSELMNLLTDLIIANSSSGMYVHSLVIGGGKKWSIATWKET